MNFKKLIDYSEPRVASVTVFVLGLFIIALYGGQMVRAIKNAGDDVVVTGSAKEAVTADTARWTIHLEAKTNVEDQQAGYARLDTAITTITTYLKKNSFEDIETPAPTSFANYVYPQNSREVLTGYTVSRDITVRSGDVAGLTALTNNIQSLSGSGYTVTTSSFELTYSKLAELRVKLLSEAIADAKARTEAIAKDSGRGVGALRNASSGVVQVLPEGGVEISDYGSYDTQSLKKEVMVTVRATYSFK